MAIAHPHDGMLGQTIGDRYRIGAVVGAGGMATVYRAFDEVLERDVAVKLMHREVAGDESQLERFRREAKAAAKLQHAHIVTVVDAGEEGGRPYIVFEFVEGETLKQRIKRLGRLPIAEAVAYAIEIGGALVAAHAAQLVHRDVKPQNVLLDRDGHAKVADFGIARELEEDGLTKTGRVLGTTDYVSPEQALGEEVTGRSDVYSLGIVLYEMLTGGVPFVAENHVAVAMKHVKEGMPDVRAKRPEMSAALAAVLDRMTAKDPQRRYRSAADAVADLEDSLAIEIARAGNVTGEATIVFDELPGRSRRLAPEALTRPFGTLAVRALAIVAVLAGAGFALLNLQRGTGEEPRIGGDRAGAVIRLTSTGTFDPPPGDGHEHDRQTGNVLDGNPQTSWTTERYQNAAFAAGKTGVGIFVKTRRATAAKALTVQTPNRDLTIEVYGAAELPPDLDGWTRLGGADGDVNGRSLPLERHSRLRYFMVWITRLPPGGQARVSEIELRG